MLLSGTEIALWIASTSPAQSAVIRRSRASVSEVKSYKDMVGAICANCGTAITEDDVEKQYLKIAEDATKDAFGKSTIDFDL